MKIRVETEINRALVMVFDFDFRSIFVQSNNRVLSPLLPILLEVPFIEFPYEVYTSLSFVSWQIDPSIKSL